MEIIKEKTPSLAGIIPHLKVNSIGIINVPIQLASKVIYLKTVVADNVNFNGDILLGISSMSDFNILIHPKEKGLYIDEEFLPFVQHSEKDNFLNTVDDRISHPQCKSSHTQKRKKKGILKQTNRYTFDNSWKEIREYDIQIGGAKHIVSDKIAIFSLNDCIMKIDDELDWKYYNKNVVKCLRNMHENKYKLITIVNNISL